MKLSHHLLILTVSLLTISAVPYAHPNLEMDGIISKEPVNGECIDGYDLTKDGNDCVRAQGVDCNEDLDSPLCTREIGIHGSIFCDEYAQLTGSRIAYGGCYDRNDTPDDYCDQYAKEDADEDWDWFCEAVCANYEDVLAKGEHCDNTKRS